MSYISIGDSIYCRQFNYQMSAGKLGMMTKNEKISRVYNPSNII